MKSMSRVVLVVAMVGGLLSAAVSAGAQEADTSGYLAAVNGASTDPVDVTANGGSIYSGLGYAGDGAAVILSPAAYEVLFTGGTVDSGANVDVAGGSAQTVVSALGTRPTAAYPVDVSRSQLVRLDMRCGTQRVSRSRSIQATEAFRMCNPDRASGPSQ